MSIVKDLIREFILTKNTYKHGGLTYLARKGFAYLMNLALREIKIKRHEGE